MRARFGPSSRGGFTLAASATRLAAAVVLAVASGLPAGCGGQGSAGTFHPTGDQAGGSAPGAPPGSARRPVAVDTAALTPAIIARYRRFQQVYETSFAMNDTSELATVATEPILSELIRTAERARAKGVYWRYHNVLNPRLIQITADGRQAVVADCVRTLGAYEYDAKTGKQLVAHDKSGLARYRAVMTLVGNTWKLSSARSEVGKC
jgi:hypothetical protein